MNNEKTRGSSEGQSREQFGEREMKRQGQSRNTEHGSQNQAFSGSANLGRNRGFSGRGGQQAFGMRGQNSGGSFMSGHPALWAALIGLGAGMGAMYLLDPNRGARRRAALSDKLMGAGSGIPNAVRVTATDISNRAGGAWAAATRLFSSDNPSDQVLEARVRSKMGRYISHPQAVHVMAIDGRVTLDGVILAHELRTLLSCVESVPGVQGVENRLQVHDQAGNVPNLQGGRNREGEQWGMMQRNWSPTAKIGAGALGLGLSAVGATLLARTLSGGSGTGRTAITIDKSINVNAPADVLFGLWSNFENFPKFMSNVLEVKNLDEKRSRWRVAGPAGVPVEWDAEITKIVPNEMIAWRSLEGSTVENAGYVLFEPNDDSSTEVTVRLSYNPPAGPIGHAVAKAFGADPKSEMDQDLMRLKTMLETGNAPHDAAQRITNSKRGDRIH